MLMPFLMLSMGGKTLSTTLPSKKILWRVPTFKAMSSSSLEILRASFERKDFLPGERLVNDGEIANTITIILVGSVDVVKTLASGEERILRSFGPGDYFGHFAVVGEQTWGASVVATSTSKCCVLTSEALLAAASKEFLPSYRSQLPAWFLRRSELNPNNIGVELGAKVSGGSISRRERFC